MYHAWNIYIIPEKNSKNGGNQNFGADFCITFSFDFEPVFVLLHRFLPGCRLFSRYDKYIHTYIHKVKAIFRVRFTFNNIAGVGAYREFFLLQ